MISCHSRKHNLSIILINFLLFMLSIVQFFIKHFSQITFNKFLQICKLKNTDTVIVLIDNTILKQLHCSDKY